MGLFSKKKSESGARTPEMVTSIQAYIDLLTDPSQEAPYPSFKMITAFTPEERQRIAELNRIRELQAPLEP